MPGIAGDDAGEGREAANRLGERLPGIFSVSNGLATVTASESMDDYLLVGDPWSTDGSKWYRVNAVSGVSITLGAVYAEGSDVSSPGYIDSSQIWLPFTSMTRFRFVAERADGGPTLVRLTDGREIKRGTGFRVELGLRWEWMDRHSYAKALIVHGYGVSNTIIVRPHDDVKMEWEMNDVTDIASAFPDGKLVGHSHEMTLRSTTLISDIPRVRNQLARAGFRPNIGI